MTTSPRIELANVFDEFIEAYETLKDVTEKKQDAIFDRDIDALETLTEKQAVLTKQLQSINEKKNTLAEKYLDDHQQVEELSLRKLQETLSESQDGHLSEKRIQLKDVIRDVQRYSRENQRLLETRMDFFEELFEELSQDNSTETYDSNKEKDTTSTDEAVIFDEAI